MRRACWVGGRLEIGWLGRGTCTAQHEYNTDDTGQQTHNDDAADCPEHD